MARHENSMITFNDAQYMALNEGFSEKSPIPGGKKCLTKSKIIQYLTVDESHLSNYLSNQLVPYGQIKPILIPCDNTFNGSVGNFSYSIDFGTQTGIIAVLCQPNAVPDNFFFNWNGIEVTTGWIGSDIYNGDLLDAGVDPNDIKTSSGGNYAQYLYINKATSLPRFATVKVRGVLSNTGWSVQGNCVGTYTP